MTCLTRMKAYFDSFGGRLTAIMTAGLLVMMLTNFVTVCAVQYLYVIQAEEDRARSIATHAALFNAAERADRERLVRVLNGQHFNGTSQQVFTVQAKAPEWGDTPAEIERQAESLRGILSSGFGTDIAVRARLLDKMNPLFEVHLPGVEFAVALSDGQWLVVTIPSQVDDRWLVWFERALALLEGVLILAVALLLTGRALAPLEALSRAAARFGRHPETSPPLEETGTREMREVTQAFNQMQGRIQGNLAERNRMVSAMTHDLRTPLTKLQLRLDRVGDERLREQLMRNVREMLAVLEQGLALARSLETDERWSRLDVRTLLASIADDYADLGHDVAVDEVDDAQGRPFIAEVRPLCLKRCIENLVTNAVSYAGSARLRVRCGKDGAACIEVLDEGPGIPADRLERVFEPYYRLEGSRNRAFGGIGLGLTIARNLAALTGATLMLSNRAGGGLKAAIVLSPDRLRDG